MSQEKQIVIGLMSGTSADGVDAALLETDGAGFVRGIAFAERPYSNAERDLIRAASKQALSMERPADHPLIREAEAVLTKAHAEAIAILPEQEAATLIGFHGQTIVHRPPSSGHPAPFTWQIGDADLLARLTRRPVVFDFRSADVAAGGEGAPLAPGYHRARLGHYQQPVGVLNLGGVGNITWFENPANSEARWGGFDTGPANALIDDWVQRHTGERFDKDGALAAGGSVNEAVVSALCDSPYFRASGPRSLDRDSFSPELVDQLNAEDGAASLTAFTAQTVALSVQALPVQLERIFVTGGGRRNPTLMQMIAERTGAKVQPVEDLGWNGDALEAEAFGWLAVRHIKGWPISWPETTGVPVPHTGGRLVHPA